MWARILTRYLNESQTSYCLSQFVGYTILTYLTLKDVSKFRLIYFSAGVCYLGQ